MMDTSKEILKLTEKLNNLEKLYEQVNEQVFYNQQMFWTILVGVFAIIGIALFFIAKSIVQSGVEKGIEKKLNQDREKADIKEPKFIGGMSINSKVDDNKNIRIVKLDDEATINIEADKNDAKLLINHKNISCVDYFEIPCPFVNGYQGESSIFRLELNDIRIINVQLSNILAGVNYINEWSIIAMLPYGFYPTSKVYFAGVVEGAEHYKLLFRIQEDGSIQVYSDQKIQNHKISVTMNYLAKV